MAANFGGYIKPANERRNRVDRRLVKHQNGKRQRVVIVRERDGKTLPAVFRSEGEALSFIRNRVAPGTEIMADESQAWNDLGARFTMKRINHQEAYSLAGACTNGAEEFFPVCAGLRSSSSSHRGRLLDPVRSRSLLA